MDEHATSSAPVSGAGGPSPAAPLTLRCLGGRAAPADLIEGARQLVALPASAKQQLWELLPPILEEPMPRAIEGAVDRFIKAHRIAANLPLALRAARILIREASALDLSPQQLAEDLARLSGGTGELGELLLRGFEKAKSRIRSDIVRRTIADTGKLLEGIRWRIDVLSQSDRGAGLKMVVVTLILRYRDAGKVEEISLQVLPDLLYELRSLCDRVLPKRK